MKEIAKGGAKVAVGIALFVLTYEAINLGLAYRLSRKWP